MHEPSKQVYQDGGLYHNNPILIANSERNLLWPDIQDPDIILSLGTGYNPAVRKTIIEAQPLQLGMISHMKNLYRMAIDHLESSLDSEKTWSSFLQSHCRKNDDAKRLRRINLPLDYDPPRLDDVSAMKRLQDTVRKQSIQLGGIIGEVARQLVASSFYLERISGFEVLPNGFVRCQGDLRPPLSVTV